MQLFYQENFDLNSKSIQFDAQESKHLAKVLRKKVGDQIYISNGSGVLATGLITSLTQKQCQIEIQELRFEKPTLHHIHLAVAPPKSIDRFEWFLEKATEIGIHEITPILTAHSERKKLKIERCERIIQAAAKQSLKLYKPSINPLTTLNQLLETTKAKEKFIAHCEDRNEKKPLIKTSSNKTSYLVLIGPEGDFSSSEIDTACSHGFKEVSLSDQRLRTETAAVVATHLLNLKQVL